MKCLLSTLLLISTITAYTQDLDCSDFKDGTFVSKVKLPDGFETEIRITREGNKQIEESAKIPQGMLDDGYSAGPKYSTVEWIDSCNYRLIMDESDLDKDPIKKVINARGGLQVRITKIDGDCYYYDSWVEGIDLVSSGKLCRVE